MTSLTLIRGLPGSGKSTLANKLLNHDNSVWCEADQYFMKDGVYSWDGMQIGAAHAWCFEKTKEAIELGLNVIVSNTFTTRKELKPYFELIQDYDQNPTVIFMQSSFVSIHGVPDNVLENMKKRFYYDISDLFKEFYEV